MRSVPRPLVLKHCLTAYEIMRYAQREPTISQLTFGALTDLLGLLPESGSEIVAGSVIDGLVLARFSSCLFRTHCESGARCPKRSDNDIYTPPGNCFDAHWGGANAPYDGSFSLGGHVPGFGAH